MPWVSERTSFLGNGLNKRPGVKSGPLDTKVRLQKSLAVPARLSVSNVTLPCSSCSSSKVGDEHDDGVCSQRQV
jgi:hypothetical protein